MLSLGWDAHWTVREGPQPSAPRIQKGASSLGGYYWGEVPFSIPVPAPVEVTVPEWVRSAWTAEEPETVARALDMFFEGLELEPHHSSFSLIAFVSSIETLGSDEGALERCETCGVVIGSGKRFRESIAKVCGPEKAKDLGKLYGPRSKTAHAGIIHGFEAAFGHMVHSKDGWINPRVWFAWNQLKDLKEANARLLKLALKAD